MFVSMFSLTFGDTLKYLTEHRQKTIKAVKTAFIVLSVTFYPYDVLRSLLFSFGLFCFYVRQLPYVFVLMLLSITYVLKAVCLYCL